MKDSSLHKRVWRQSKSQESKVVEDCKKAVFGRHIKTGACMDSQKQCPMNKFCENQDRHKFQNRVQQGSHVTPPFVEELLAFGSSWGGRVSVCYLLMI